MISTVLTWTLVILIVVIGASIAAAMIDSTIRTIKKNHEKENS